MRDLFTSHFQELVTKTRLKIFYFDTESLNMIKRTIYDLKILLKWLFKSKKIVKC